MAITQWTRDAGVAIVVEIDYARLRGGSNGCLGEGNGRLANYLKLVAFIHYCRSAQCRLT